MSFLRCTLCVLVSGMGNGMGSRGGMGGMEGFGGGFGQGQFGREGGWSFIIVCFYCFAFSILPTK